MTSDLKEIDVSDDEHGQRLDRLLASRLAQISRTRLKDLILAGAVRDGDAVLVKPNHRVSAGDVVTLDLPPPEAAIPGAEAIPLNIVFEDAHLIVIDKPAGLVVHPAPGHWQGTLVNALLHHCADSLSGIGGVKRPGIVHRLDKDTSGLIVAAKSNAAHQGLAAQFADHGRSGPLHRLYLALCWGVPERPRFTVAGAIGRDPRNRLKMAIVPEHLGREAITHVERRAVYMMAGKPGTSLNACRLETGRTHQIRVHLTHAGLPLLGDDVYGTGFRTKAAKLPPSARMALEKLGRQALHAAELGFEHPVTGEIHRFSSPFPADLAVLRDALDES
ncbi:RluA family pseudouridine synthase [Candidatus Raskinella chloraquaticus]|uniref:RluA family pseudouridine synthase n=1 Tax=Candidatus Raskinella chloraquaticus TaxID=1951219 RepID=UPI003672167C